MDNFIDQIQSVFSLSHEDIKSLECLSDDLLQKDLESFVRAEFGAPDISEVKVPVVSSNIEAMMALEQAAEDFRANPSYGAIRQKFVAASFAANEICLTAPIFRAQPKMSGKRVDWTKQTQLLQDLILIDCHWLYCRREAVDAKWPEVQRALDGSRPFLGEEIMDRVARKKWSSGFRAEELLALTHRQQYQLVQLKDESVKQRMRLLIDGGARSLGMGSDGKERKARVRAPFPEIRRKIKEWAEARPAIQSSVRMYESLWLARELLGAKAPLKHYAELAALRCGCKPLSTKTIDEKLKALDRRLGEFS